MAAANGLVTSGEIVAWLMSDFGLEHGHANTIASVIVHADTGNASSEDKVAALFTASKAQWRTPRDSLTAAARSLLRGL